MASTGCVMSHEPTLPVITVWRRATACPATGGAIPALHATSASTSASASAAAVAADAPETVYGVSVRAVQRCCGRGCRHCRVYHHRGPGRG